MTRGDRLLAAALLFIAVLAITLPILLIASVPTGFFTGYILKSLITRLEKAGQLRGMTRE